VTAGQLDLEWQHLLSKLAIRSPEHRAQVVTTGPPAAHPLFVVVPGPVASWERAS
jgi:hypothetical protein